MSLSFNIVDRDVWGKSRISTVDVTLDSSYTYGGYAIAASSVDLVSIRGADEIGRSASASYQPLWNTASSKLMIASGNVEVGGGTSLAGVTLRLEFKGY